MAKSNSLGMFKKLAGFLPALLLGDTRELIARIDERTLRMAADLREMKPKVDDMFPKVDILWKERIASSRSPRTLNDRGMAILNESGIKKFVDDKKEQLLELVRIRQPQTAYDAEAEILSVMMDAPRRYPGMVEELKRGAFRSGAGINDILLAGGIYLRDLVFADLGFDASNLDR